MRAYTRFFKLLLILALLASVVPVAASPTDRSDSGYRALRQNPLATLNPVQGLIQYRPANADPTAWRTVTDRILVGQGDFIRTDALGLAELTFFEGLLTEILPNTVVMVSELAQPDQDSYQVTLDMLVGDTHNVVDKVLDAQSRFEIHTPNAVIAVRGTNFWVSLTWQLELRNSAVTGTISTQGILPDGTPGKLGLLGAGEAVSVSPQGEVGLPEPITVLPQYPPKAPLAPPSIGDGICDLDKGEFNSVDCIQVQTCGDGICQLDKFEGPITCEADCVPQRGAGGAAQTTGEPCTAQASRGDVALRVGPGFNRGVRDYLKPNVSFPVIGQAQASDNSLWWQLEIAGVPQAWVSQDEVAASGDCAHVGEAAAPPIVRPHPTGPTPAGPTPVGATPAPASIYFYADRYTIYYGECATIYWDVEGIQEVYYEGSGVVGHSYSVECPYSQTTYQLMVTHLDGSTTYHYVTIDVVYS